MLELVHGKNPGISVDEAKRKIITRLAMIETSRPLEKIYPKENREKAALVRDWYRHTFASPAP